jgi:uncharacterized membrane protein
MKMKDKSENYNLMSKNPDNWKGIFYVNRKDPRLIVSKINPSLGWTLNFGHVYAYLGLIAIIVIIAASQYFM